MQILRGPPRQHAPRQYELQQTVDSYKIGNRDLPSNIYCVAHEVGMIYLSARGVQDVLCFDRTGLPVLELSTLFSVPLGVHNKKRNRRHTRLHVGIENRVAGWDFRLKIKYGKTRFFCSLDFSEPLLSGTKKKNMGGCQIFFLSCVPLILFNMFCVFTVITGVRFMPTFS